MKIGQSTKALAANTISANESIASSNTVAAASYAQIGVDADLAAKTTVAASLRSTDAAEAQILALRRLSTSATESAAVRARAAALATKAEVGLARAQGLAVVSTGRLSSATKEGEKDLNKLVRGGLAGSGALSALGRSLAFASTGFIAFATGATVIKESIAAAQDEAVAQRQVARQLQTSGKSWQQYGGQIDKVLLKESHLAGFTKAELLQSFGFLVRVGGNVQNSLKLTGLAADISRARNISLAAASIALSKALGGSATALRRLGIIVPKGVSTTAALAFVTEKFAGQARAGTTVTERFHATLVDTGAAIGKVLLPTFNRLTTEFTDWLGRMQESGRLQKDVTTITKDLGDAFHAVGGVIQFVDKITGSFVNTLKILLALEFARVLNKSWLPALASLAKKWVGVTAAAEAATVAQREAAASGAAGGGAAGLGLGGAFGLGAAAPVLGLGLGAAALGSFLGSRGGPKQPAVGAGNNAGVLTKEGGSFFVTYLDTGSPSRPGGGKPGKFRIGPAGALTLSGVNLQPQRQQPGGARFGPTLGTGFEPTKPAIFKTFTDPIRNQLAQARALLTKSTADDVAAAKAEIAIIKAQIKAGHLKGASLVQALSAQAGAVATIQQAEADAIQRQTARLEAAIDPVRLEIGLAQAELSGSTPRVIRALKALRAAAQKMLDSGKLSADQQLRALQQIISLNQQIKDAATQTTAQFQVPAKLALRLARDTALGRSTTKDLLSIRKAILRFIATHKHNLAALTDAYNQLADINQQLGSTAGTALGLFKQASTRALTRGLGLTDEQRKQLRARLSQLGPGGTVPGHGVGAAGFVIGPDGRPIQVHGRGPTISARDSQTVSPQRFNRLLRVLEQVSRRPIRVVVDLDGRIIADNTTRHQQNRHRRNSSQRRGPNAGLAGA